MSAKLFYIEVLVITFFSLMPWQNTNIEKVICSKDNTRLVRKLIQTKWMPIFEKHKVKLSKECPLHPIRDVFRHQQEMKKRNRPSQWTCKLCGKSFYEEKFLDSHFENRHENLQSKTEDSICLADFCNIMRCDVFQTHNHLLNENSYGITDIEIWGHASQNSLSDPSNQMRTSLTQTGKKNLFHSKYSTALLNIPNSQKRTNSICEKGEKIISFEKQKKGAKKYYENKIYNESNCNKTHIIDGNGNLNEQFLNIQKMKAQCKPEELLKLQKRCESLIRMCITGLLLEMSDYEFKEMEDELNKAVCWYLNCDRYWEDGPLHPRSFPWGLILVLVLILSLGVCFCYYIIWVLFESDETVKTNQHKNPIHSKFKQEYYPEKRIDDNIRVSTISLVPTETRDTKFNDDFILSSDPNDLAHSEHYIYVTYPPELKRRLLEKYD